MKLSAVLGLVGLCMSFQAMATCKITNAIGVGYGQASYNCEAVLQGQVTNCHPTGNDMWVCGCATDCRDNGGGNGDSNSRYTNTIGVGYGQASYNCEAVMQGQAVNCHPSVNDMWVCGCYY